jgi:hypothetical protein
MFFCPLSPEENFSFVSNLKLVSVSKSSSSLNENENSALVDSNIASSSLKASPLIELVSRLLILSLKMFLLFASYSCNAPESLGEFF